MTQPSTPGQHTYDLPTAECDDPGHVIWDGDHAPGPLSRTKHTLPDGNKFVGQTLAGSGYALYDSPTIDLPTTAGTIYGLGVGFQCDVGDTSWLGLDVGIGDFLTSYYDDAYPGYSATFVPPSYNLVEQAYFGEVVMIE